jgi:glycopeptide antibiotics resistance protein
LHRKKDIETIEDVPIHSLRPSNSEQKSGQTWLNKSSSAAAHSLPTEVKTYDWGPVLFYMAVLSIALLTLFPYQILPQQTASSRQGPFWMWLFEKLPDGKDFVANILLFVPFGFAVAWLLERRFRWFAALLIACLGSFVFSFGIEFTQAYMPTRTSSWYDVAANTMGGPIGWLVFRVLGTRVEKMLSALLTGFYKALHPPVLALFFIAYWAAGTFISVPLSRMSILRNWDDSLPLFVGNIPGQSYGWRGSVSEIAFADRYLDSGVVERVFQSGLAAVPPEILIASYRPGAAPVTLDATGKSPSLSWTPSVPPTTAGVVRFEPRGPWLKSQSLASSLASAIRAANQFTLYVVCETPQAVQIGWHPIVALGDAPKGSDLVLGQYYSSLSLRMRTPLTPRADRRPEYSAGEFFFQPGIHRLLFTYDGAKLYFYADGKRAGPVMELGPGAAAVRILRRPRQYELPGYKMIYYALLFVPLGCALALITMISKRAGSFAAGCALFLPGLILEPILFATGLRPLYPENILLGAGLAIVSFVFVRRYLPR